MTGLICDIGMAGDWIALPIVPLHNTTTAAQEITFRQHIKTLPSVHLSVLHCHSTDEIKHHSIVHHWLQWKNVSYRTMLLVKPTTYGPTLTVDIVGWLWQPTLFAVTDSRHSWPLKTMNDNAHQCWPMCSTGLCIQRAVVLRESHPCRHWVIVGGKSLYQWIMSQSNSVWKMHQFQLLTFHTTALTCETKRHRQTIK